MLVIDDDPRQRDLMQRFLTRRVFASAPPQVARRGCGLARQLQPAAITLDVMMPDMDGWSVLSR